ncbi:hypothetical protein DYB36_008195 [Aphanomyces astaci]|uniref:Uncharacterized protein n=1 Tax=Aphanomyces astaci TaxID=112090 RepID=A0A397A4G7_APHAT|nr:hypothetical protein DYB36_008195 [Aphanomyces astaci]
MEKSVTSSHMIQFLRAGHMAWLQDYMATRASGYNSLLRLLQNISDRHGFSKQRVCLQKETQQDLEETRLAFGKQFHADHPDYDMCPSTIWAVRSGGSYVANSETHSYRMTALPTLRTVVPSCFTLVKPIQDSTNLVDFICAIMTKRTDATFP